MVNSGAGGRPSPPRSHTPARPARPAASPFRSCEAPPDDPCRSTPAPLSRAPSRPRRQAGQAVPAAAGAPGRSRLHGRRPRRLSLPPHLTYDPVRGYSLFATRTELSGGGDELLEPARTNLHELPLLRRGVLMRRASRPPGGGRRGRPCTGRAGRRPRAGPARRCGSR
ncbi:hypothetical protein ELQ39_29420 [Streptomyces sp. GB4-14]|nr:hypothetical protein [Streptomyces sp. GB4-14]